MTLAKFSTTASRKRTPDSTCGILIKMNSSICRRRDGGFVSDISPPSARPAAVISPCAAAARPLGPRRFWPKPPASRVTPGRYSQSARLLILRRQRLGLVIERLEHRIVFGDFGADRLEPFLELRLLGIGQMDDFAAAAEPDLAQLRHLVDGRLPRPRLQLARLVDDDLAQVGRQLVKPRLAHGAERDEQRVVRLQQNLADILQVEVGEDR